MLRPQIAVATVVGAYALAVITGVVPQDTAGAVSTWITVVLPFVTAAFCYRAARRSTARTRTGWALLGISMSCVGVSSAMWVATGGMSGNETQGPGLADLIVFLTLPLAIVALFKLSVPRDRASALRRCFDALLIGAAFFVAAWSLVVHALYDGAAGGLGYRVLTIAYPVLEILFVTLIAFLAVRPSRANRQPILLIGGGLFFWVFTDSVYAYMNLAGTYRAGHPVELGWILGYVLLLNATLVSQSGDAAQDQQRPATWRIHLPYAVAAAGLVATASAQIARGEIDAVTLIAAGTVVLFVVARQFVLILENKSMTIEHMRSVDEMKNRILQAVSHELRTPLTFIKGAALLLNDEADDFEEDHRELLSRLVHNCDRLEDFLVGLLDLERLTRGVIEPARRQTELSSLVSTVVSNVGAPAHEVSGPTEEHWANVDPAQVERIVENLIINAVRHTPAGTKVQTVIERCEEGVMITVSDNGPGVPDEVKQRIFQPFKQGPSKSTVIRGTGVGLALVEKFAELHGGRAWVEDSDGGGASFRVVLPEATASVAA